MKKIDKTTVLLILILVAGLSLVLYPSVADWWNSFHQSHAIADYDAALEQMEQVDYDRLFSEAEQYNEALRKIEYPLMNYEDVPGYYDLLDITGNGLMGYVRIPKIGVKLPVYHGTSEGVLQVAVGHLEGTSLPVGGVNTHCVLSAHRGLPSAKLFSDLDEMEVGDVFSLTVADRQLTYMVDQILIVLPQEVEDLYVQEGMDLCTLITCTPYGINSHRLLVRGVRVDDSIVIEQRLTADAVRVDPMIVSCVLFAMLAVLGGAGVLIYKKASAAKKAKSNE